jgi:HEAT repeat protein
MATHASSEPPLQPVEAPPPWQVVYNTLRALEPAELPADDPRWGWFTEDLLQVVHPSGLRIDLGWRPDGSPAGAYRLVVVQGDDWSHPVHSATLGSLAEVLSAVAAHVAERAPAESGPVSDEVLLAEIGSAEDPRDAAAQVLVLRERGSTSALVGLLTDPRPRVRYAAVDALTVLGDPAAGEALLARFLLPEPDLDTRRRLIDALAATGHRPAAPVLARWLVNPDAEQRIAAARALVRLEAVEALDALTEAYATERSPKVREQLQDALRRLAQARKRTT